MAPSPADEHKHFDHFFILPPDDGISKHVPRRTHPKRPRVSTKAGKEPQEPEYYVKLHLDAYGRPCITSSPSLKSRKNIIVGDAVPRFLSQIVLPHSESLADHIKEEASSPDDLRASPTFLTPVQSQADVGCITAISQGSRRPKRRRSESSVIATAPEPDKPEISQGGVSIPQRPDNLKTIQLRLDDSEACHDYFKFCFQTIQQIDCRFIAKRWIKRIEPKKQVLHPYNGGRSSPKDPERTKPDWWPSDIIHKEPDHINREARIQLLTHIIMHTGTDLLTTSETSVLQPKPPILAKDLREVTEPYKTELRNTKSWSILEDMFGVRKYMEGVESGEYDADTTIKVVADHSDAARRIAAEPESHIGDPVELASTDTRTSEEDQADEEGANERAAPALTPASSTKHSPASNANVAVGRQLALTRSREHGDMYDSTPPPYRRTTAPVDPDHSTIDRLLTFGPHHNHASHVHHVSQFQAPSMSPENNRVEQQLLQQQIAGVGRSLSEYQQQPQRQQRQSHHQLIPTHINPLYPGPLLQWSMPDATGSYYATQYTGQPSQPPPIPGVSSEQASMFADDSQFGFDPPDIHYIPTAFERTINHRNTPGTGPETNPHHLPIRPASGSLVPTTNVNVLDTLWSNDSSYDFQMSEQQHHF